jgi:hypothetical protein
MLLIWEVWDDYGAEQCSPGATLQRSTSEQSRPPVRKCTGSGSKRFWVHKCRLGRTVRLMSGLQGLSSAVDVFSQFDVDARPREHTGRKR